MTYILVSKPIDYIIEELNFCSHKWVKMSEDIDDIIVSVHADEYSVITKEKGKLTVQSYLSWVSE